MSMRPARRDLPRVAALLTVVAAAFSALALAGVSGPHASTGQPAPGSSALCCDEARALLERAGRAESDEEFLELVLPLETYALGASDPDLAGTAWYRLGWTYLALHRSEDADEAFRRALAAFEFAVLPESRPLHALTLLEFGILEMELGRAEDGAQALDLAETLAGGLDRLPAADCVGALTRLAQARNATGRTKDARRTLQRVHDLVVKASLTDESVPYYYDVLAQAQEHDGELELAVASRRRAAGLLQELGLRFPLGIQLQLLAFVLEKTGKLDEARATYREGSRILADLGRPDVIFSLLRPSGDIVAAFEVPIAGRADFMRARVERLARFLGPEDPIVAQAQVDTIVQKLDEGTGGDAEAAILEHAVVVLEREHGPDHPSVVGALEAFAHLRWAQQRLPEAIALNREATVRAERIPGFSRLVLSRLISMGAQMSAHAQAAPPEETIARMRRATALLENEYGPDHVATVMLRRQLADLLDLLDRLDEAKAAYDQVIPALEREYGPRELVSVYTRTRRASVLHRAGRSAEAESELRHLVSLMDSVLPPVHAARSQLLSMLAQTLAPDDPEVEITLRTARAARPPDEGIGFFRLDDAQLLVENLCARRKFAECAVEARTTLDHEPLVKDDPQLRVVFEQHLAVALGESGRSAEALAAMGRTLDTLRGIEPSARPIPLAPALVRTGAALRRIDLALALAALWDESARANAYGPLITLTTGVELAAALLEAGATEAAAQVLGPQDVPIRFVSSKHPDALRAIVARWADLASRCGRSDDAEGLRVALATAPE